MAQPNSTEKHHIHLDPISIYAPKAQDLLVERADEKQLRAVFDKVI